MISKIRNWFEKNKADIEDILRRAVKTFLQAFLSAIVIDAPTIQNGFSMMKPMLISGLAAGISAVMNFILTILRRSMEKDSAENK